MGAMSGGSTLPASTRRRAQGGDWESTLFSGEGLVCDLTGPAIDLQPAATVPSWAG